VELVRDRVLERRLAWPRTRSCLEYMLLIASSTDTGDACVPPDVRRSMVDALLPTLIAEGGAGGEEGALVAAAYDGDLEAVRRLLGGGASEPPRANCLNGLALKLAASSGRREIVEELLQRWPRQQQHAEALEQLNEAAMSASSERGINSLLHTFLYAMLRGGMGGMLMG
jgi:hypothetical protein